jgi:nicotinamidase-related amidase
MTARLDPQRTALVVVDAQHGFRQRDERGERRNNPGAEATIARLLEAFRERGARVVHVRHDSDEPGSLLRRGLPGFAPLPEARERVGEPVMVKHVNAAWIGTDLEARLRDAGVESVVLVGATTNHCVETTARMGGNLGFAVELVHDATWTYDLAGPGGRTWPAELLHEATLANVDGEFGEVVSAAEVLARLTAPAADDRQGERPVSTS